MTKNNQDKIDIAVMASQVVDIKSNVNDIKKKLEDDYITKQEFEPIKRVVYGIVTVFGLGTVGAILKLILIK